MNYTYDDTITFWDGHDQNFGSLVAGDVERPCDRSRHKVAYSGRPTQTFSAMNDGQEALRRLASQLRRAGNGSPGGPVGPKGLFAGGGLLVALIAGGLALNASLFNGMAHWIAMMP